MGGAAPWTFSEAIRVMTFPTVQKVHPSTQLAVNLPTTLRLSLKGTSVSGKGDLEPL